MLKSMTGFGRAKLEKNNRVYNIEIKSVNHKYTDISIKMPRSLSYLEESVKKEIVSSISRGKIDVFITFENYSDEGKEIIINKDLIKKYVEEFNIIAKENNLSMDIPVTEITKLPDVLNIKKTDDDEDIIAQELKESGYLQVADGQENLTAVLVSGEANAVGGTDTIQIRKI